MALLHARMLARQECGPDAGREARLPGSVRSQIIHYLKGIPGAAATRGMLVRVETLGDIEDALEAMREGLLRMEPRGVLALCSSETCLTFARSDGILTPN